MNIDTQSTTPNPVEYTNRYIADIAPSRLNYTVFSQRYTHRPYPTFLLP